ncbi:hypothetical protein HSBAA_17530 [Vreelandella sulfidaeris]|uniref:tRNA-specific 2-thiouridylase MnmA-like central domain-containing protein n=1 Tax=Vreelandella sulfidaeris TaxID=115553 RepID=A0A455U4H0_9GAMM|nr:hypothetical protein HSBAA_17530 [Halomonas sulfidaeris]
MIGDHMGLMYYTLGQRQGLGIGGLANYSEEPWYVAAKDLDRNVLIAVQGKHDQLLYSDTLATEKMDWWLASRRLNKAASPPRHATGKATAAVRCGSCPTAALRSRLTIPSGPLPPVNR